MLNNRELATVLAALRYWQREGLHSSGHERDIATDEGLYTAMTSAEIDRLADRLNRDGSSIAGDGDDRKRLQRRFAKFVRETKIPPFGVRTPPHDDSEQT